MADREKPGDDFDWMTARRTCSIEAKFAELKAAALRDIDAAMQRLGIPCTIEQQSDRHLYVECRGARRGRSARFMLTGDQIEVDLLRGQETIETMTGRIALNDFGECVWKVDGVELRSWEIRQRALGRLFFE